MASILHVSVLSSRRWPNVSPTYIAVWAIIGNSFIPSFIPSFVPSFIPTFTHSFIRSIDRLMDFSNNVFAFGVFRYLNTQMFQFNPASSRNISYPPVVGILVDRVKAENFSSSVLRVSSMNTLHKQNNHTHPEPVTKVISSYVEGTERKRVLKSPFLKFGVPILTRRDLYFESSSLVLVVIFGICPDMIASV